MKHEETERFLIEELFRKTQKKGILSNELIEDIEKLTGDASTRRYYRVFSSTKKQEFRQKNSYVVCLDNPFEKQIKDHPFLSTQKFLRDQGIEVPRIIDFDLSKGYILQEDLGNKTLLHHLSEVKDFQDEKEIYQQVLLQLVKFHQIEPSEHDFSNLKFDFNKFMEEVRFTIQYFTMVFNKDVSEFWKKDLEVLFSPLCQRLADKKMVVTHRDFHSRNIMVTRDRFVFIDFQDARMGIPQYDLVSLLEDCYYSVENKDSLIKFYFEHMTLSDQSSFREFSFLYQDMAIQRLFKAVGSFCYIYTLRQDIRYLKYIGFAMEKLRVLLMMRPEFSHLKKTLFTYYYAN